MEIGIFAAKVCGAMKERFGREYEVEVREVVKNNGVILHGIMTRHREGNISSTVYLESFLEAYESGVPFGAVLQEIADSFGENIPKAYVDMGFFMSFEKVRDRICYRLVGKDGNGSLLEDMPHVEFLIFVSGV